jgi:hypothetical protein
MASVVRSFVISPPEFLLDIGLSSRRTDVFPANNHLFKEKYQVIMLPMMPMWVKVEVGPFPAPAI